VTFDGAGWPRRNATASWGRVLSALATIAVASCGNAPMADFPRRTLTTLRNPYRGDRGYFAQPRRDRPLRVAVSPDGATAVVTLQGLEDEPRDEISIVDLTTRTVRGRVRVGSSPTGVAIHPGGRFAVVTNRYSSWASVVDLRDLRVVADVPTAFYATDVAFTPDGRRAYVSNRWRGTVVRWDLDVGPERFAVTDPHATELAASTHARDVAISADGSRLAVAGVDGMHVHLYELPSERLASDIHLHAPANDVVFAGGWLMALTQGPGSGHPPLVGPDTDDDGRPGDSTANANFQDQQNEIAVFRASDGAPAQRYTSDSTCCHDARDVDPSDPMLGRFLPDRRNWIVGGSVPEAAAVCPSATGLSLWVGYMGSSEVETFAIDLATGGLRPVTRSRVGWGVTDIACVGAGAAVVTQLSESIELLTTPGATPEAVVVGDTRDGRFPSSDVEIGEIVNVVTAPFSVDGDQSCVMCHREFGSVERAFSMPMLRHPEAARLTMPQRGMADSRPWFLEGAMDEINFFPVLSEFAPINQFCCTDPSLWSEANPAPADCPTRPPAICAARPFPHNFATRNAFYQSQSIAIIGRGRSFGDTFDSPLNFQGLTRALGESLLVRSRLLANPNPGDTADVRRGRALFESSEVGCSTCHTGAALAASNSDSPVGRLHFAPVISPSRMSDGSNGDLVNDLFLVTFPEVVQADGRIEFGVPVLRGLWARGNLFLHDGRARNLREVLLTPGHPALRPGERGFNEVDGIPDTHGATSSLSARQLDDLIAYILAQ